MRSLAPLVILFAVSVGGRAESPSGAVDEPAPAAIDDLRRFVEVFREIQRSYVRPVGDRELMDAAIRGLLLGLDPHSAYLEAEQLEALAEEGEGRYGGLGLEVQVQDGALVVVAPLEGSPSAAAGLRPGDVISRVDGTPVERHNAAAMIERMRGTPGSSVVLTIVRGAEAPRDVRLVRAIIQVPSVQARWLEAGLAYLRIAQFQGETARQVQSAIEGLRRERSLAGLVLDLRGNPGGLLEAAVAVADQLLDSGLIVYTEGRAANAALRFEAAPGDLLAGAPLVVMIDDGSASAAEILAGALQDHRRALVVGRRSFGKGSVQSILPLDNGDGIKLTTALYYTPSGRSIQAEGIVPDVPLAAVSVRPEEPGRATTEADLSGHLDNMQSSASPARAAGASWIGEDYAVQEALYILKALVAFRR